MLMAMYMKETGRMTRLTGMGSTLMWMDLDTKGSGSKINSTAWELRGGLMVHPMRDYMLTERSMEEASSHGLMQALSLETSSIIISMVQVYMNGLTEGSSMEIGSIIKWKDMAHSHGLMEESTLANTSMT
jgi:hypothetical protein